MKTRLLFVILFAVLASSGVLPGTASAQDESLNKARDAFDSGQDLFQQEKFLEAAAKFKEAYDSRPFAQFLFNIGACYEKANQYAPALEYYNKYLEAKPGDDDVVKTQQRIKALAKAIEEIQASGADPAQPTEAMKGLEKIEIRGLVVIESEPQGADIYLDSRDSKPLSKTPWNGTLSGEHLIIIERKGYKSVERTVRPDPNKLLVLVFGLGEQDYLGYLDVTSNIPGAEIYIDDKAVGAKAKTPWSGEIKPGKHKIWVTKDGYTEYETEIDVVAGETHKVTANIEGAEVGYLNVRGKGVERVKVYVDGKVLCKRGPCLKPLDAGKHRVSIRRSGYRNYNQTIEVQSKTEVTMRATLEKEASRKDLGIWCQTSLAPRFLALALQAPVLRAFGAVCLAFHTRLLRGENGAATVPFHIVGAAPISGIAFGNTDASTATDLLALSGQSLSIVSDYQNQTSPDAAVSCSLMGTTAGLLIADVDAAEAAEVLLAVDGTIAVASASALAAAAAAEEGCFDTVPALATIDAPANEASFGTQILSGDFDGNGERDLVVSAPAQRAVYLFMNWNTTTPSEGILVSAPTGATEFGMSLAIGDFDGDGRDELVIGDPAQRADGHARAGVVYLYTTSSSGELQTAIELHDAQPENDQRFGQSLTVSQAFGGENLVVGAKNEVFTYFRTPVAGDDDFRK
jgi:hypothetical protein